MAAMGTKAVRVNLVPMPSINPNGLKVYPEFPRGDHAAGGDQLIHNGSVWQANWWTNSTPSSADASWKAVCKI